MMPISALASAARKALPGERILLANRTPEKARALAEKLGARAVDNAAAGAQSITTLKTQLDSFNTFYQGIINYTYGVDSASAGAYQLADGSDKLKDGTATITFTLSNTEKTKVYDAQTLKVTVGSGGDSSMNWLSLVMSFVNLMIKVFTMILGMIG